jgi:hypothetical protein
MWSYVGNTRARNSVSNGLAVWRWRRCFLPKRRFSKDLHGAISHKTRFFRFNFTYVYAYIKKKQGELQIKFRKMYWLLGRRSELSMYNKLLLYKQVLRPLWTYGVQLRGWAKKSIIDIIQRYQNKILRCLVNVPWYARLSNIHRDLGVETVASIIARHAISQENRLQHHVVEEASRRLNVQHLIRRHKRTKPFELVKQFWN